MTIAADMELDLVEIESELGQTATHGGVAYSCTVMSPTESREMDDIPGWSPDADTLIVVRRSLLATAPVIGGLWIHDGSTYRVESVEFDAAGVAYNLQMSSQHGR